MVLLPWFLARAPTDWIWHNNSPKSWSCLTKIQSSTHDREVRKFYETYQYFSEQVRNNHVISETNYFGWISLKHIELNSTVIHCSLTWRSSFIAVGLFCSRLRLDVSRIRNSATLVASTLTKGLDRGALNIVFKVGKKASQKTSWFNLWI
jgi:hypothetical protein